jgi:uncharacterized protein DUF4401
MNAAQLVDALRARGIIAGDAAPLPSEPDDRPWFLSLLMGLAGWMAGIFVLVFVGIFLDLKAARDLLVIGVVLLGVAWLLYFIGRSRVFFDQLALALSIAGQFAIAGYLLDALGSRHDPLLFTTAMLALQLGLFVVMPDRVARTLAAFFACVAWVFVVRFWLRPGEGDGLFLDSVGHPAAPIFGLWTLPIEWLITWAPLMFAVTWLRITEARWMARAVGAFARPAITGLILGLALAGLGVEPVSLLVLGDDVIGRSFDWWALFPLLSVGLAMFAAYNACALRSAGLLGLSIVAALMHLSRFYYLYGTTLTVKALIMLIVGAALLGTAVLVERQAAKGTT